VSLLVSTCNIIYGPPLVLAAAVPRQVMVVHPGIVVADMLAKHYTHLIHSDRSRARGGDVVGPGPDQLAAAQQALADLGVTVADLQYQSISPAAHVRRVPMNDRC
jgi:hypothetical protein